MAQVKIQLRTIEDQLASLASDTADRASEFQSEYQIACSEIYTRRYELVTGQEQPTKEELVGWAGPADVKASTAKGVPFFWLTVLSQQPTIAEFITPRDRLALEYLRDVRLVQGLLGTVVEFHFAANRFFEDTVLRRGVCLVRNAEGDVVDTKEEASGVEWQDGQSLLVKEVLKKGRGGSKKSGKKGGKAAEAAADDVGPKRRFKACPSFFRFFYPMSVLSSSGPARRGAKPRVVDPTALDEEEEEEDAHNEEEEEEEAAAGPSGRAGEADGQTAASRAAAAKMSRDSAILHYIITEVLPQAVHLYCDGLLQPYTADESPSLCGESDSEGFEVISGGGGGGAAARPQHARSVLHALRHGQRRLDALKSKLRGQEWDLARQVDDQAQRLCDQRRALLVQGDRLSLTQFWLRALRSTDVGVRMVQRRDERLLARLADVRWRWDWEGAPSAEDFFEMADAEGPVDVTPPDTAVSGRLELEFLPNDRLVAPLLVKQYTVAFSKTLGSPLALVGVRLGPAGSGSTGGLLPLSLVDSEATSPEWLEGRDLTQALSSGRRRQPASFFCLFKQGALRHAFGLRGEGREAVAEATELERQLVADLLGQVIRGGHALDLYSAVHGDDDEEDDDDDSEDDDDEEDAGEEDELLSSDEEDEVGGEDGDGDGDKDGSRTARRAAAAARRAAEQHTASLGRMNGAQLLGFMLLMVLIAQLFLFFDSASFWRSTL